MYLLACKLAIKNQKSTHLDRNGRDPILGCWRGVTSKARCNKFYLRDRHTRCSNCSQLHSRSLIALNVVAQGYVGWWLRMLEKQKFIFYVICFQESFSVLCYILPLVRRKKKVFFRATRPMVTGNEGSRWLGECSRVFTQDNLIAILGTDASIKSYGHSKSPLGR